MVSTVQKSYRKNILREMKSSISRVVSLFGIVALGVMMLTGLMCIAPDMRTAAQKYYVQQNVFDLRVLSTLGLSQGDISAIAAVDGVDAVQAVKYQDVEGHWTGNEQTTVARLYQLPADPQADTPENMNRPVLLSGRMPEAAGECGSAGRCSRWWARCRTRCIFPPIPRAAPWVMASWTASCLCRRAL